MNTPCHINNSVDFVLGAAPHHGPCPPVIIGSVEGATQYWPPGDLCNQNKLTRTVKHHHKCIVLDGHDIGTLIPHLTIPLLANPWLFYIVPMSSCKIQFSASTVKMEKKAVGCASFSATTPMMTCGEPTGSPLSFPVSNCFVDKVKVGMTPGDFYMGWAQIAATMALNLILFKIFGAKSTSVVNKYLSQFHPGTKELIKKAVAFVTGYVITGSGKVSIGIPLFKIDFEVKRSGNLGEIIDGKSDGAGDFIPSEAKISANALFYKAEYSTKSGGSTQAYGQKPQKLF